LIEIASTTFPSIKTVADTVYKGGSAQ
jgi:hypothetical protein